MKRAGCIQYDPLNVVGRNADLVLQARISDYSKAMLEKLLYADRVLIDGGSLLREVLELWKNRGSRARSLG